jgi:hypothetical protein
LLQAALEQAFKNSLFTAVILHACCI